MNKLTPSAPVPSGGRGQPTPGTNHQEVHVYLGTITRPLPFASAACGAGIVVCAFDPRTGRLTQRQVIGDILNPNYLALDETGENVFAVTCDMEAPGELHAFRRGADGCLTAAGCQATGARVGCHVAALPGGRVCVTSYVDSSIAVFPMRHDGLGPREFQARYEGRSVNPARQEASHAHQSVVSPEGRWLLVCDLGTDRIWRHALKDGAVAPGAADPLVVPAGYGPRHLAFHPVLPRAYVICELNACVLDCGWQPVSGRLTIEGSKPSLPPDWRGEPAAAAIRAHPSGCALWISNRNHDSLAFFILDQLGRPTLAGHLSAGGSCPRDFEIDPTGRWLLACNQDSNEVAIHELDSHTGLPTGQTPRVFAANTPASILICGRQPTKTNNQQEP